MRASDFGEGGSYKAQGLVTEDIEAYLEQHRHKSMLRFITCGSVDDGKSTLIGRLLYDSKMIFEDQLAALEADSRKMGTQGQEIGFALLVDGLAAEREQGITIDVAYRFFSTDRRKFIVADTPGHEQYTRNMVTGASTADLAVILIDARKGVLTQTRRHSYLTHLIGIRNIVLAVNTMDLVGYDQARFEAIVTDYRAFAERLGITAFTAIPISGFKGDNITTLSANTPWYSGPALIEHLERVPLDQDRLAQGPLRMAVQWVNRPNLDFRGFAGFVNGGRVRVGDAVRVLPSGKTSTVSRIVTQEGDLEEAVVGQSVTLCLGDEIDCSRGDVITTADAPVEVADQFEATLVWMAEEPMLPGRTYLAKIGASTLPVTITEEKYEINVNTLEHLAGKTLGLNGIAVCNLSFDRAVPFTPYAENGDLGGFILIDRMTSATVGAGMIHFSLRRAHNIHWQSLEVDRDAHAEQKRQAPRIVWFTGLSGAGKSTIANLVAKRLFVLGKHVFLLDGAAAVLVGSADFGRASGLKPRARVRAFASIGSEPAIMLTGPMSCTERLLKRAGMQIGDIDLFEVNEAFASVVMSYMRHFDLPHDKVNVAGGAIALGHPLGATGAMLLGTVLDEMERRDLNTAVITLCAAAGMATATLIERV